MKRVILSYFSLLLLIGCGTFKNAETTSIEEVYWLLGTWENRTSRGSIYESWSVVSEHEMAGKSYALRGSDTMVFETVQLIGNNQGFFYTPTVNNQNDGQAVPFKATMITEKKMIFENPEHDFPQIISYTQITPDSLVASISGTVNGEKREQVFPMRRRK